MINAGHEERINHLLKEYNNFNKEAFSFRTLEEGDYSLGYFELLSQLTVAYQPEYNDWVQRFNEIKQSNLTKIFVVELEERQDPQLQEGSQIKKKIIGTITCAIELKFIRNLGSICHIEDFVINSDYRNKKIGSKLIDLAKEFTKIIGCYKIILDSKDELVPFYEKCGFKKTSNGLAIYL